MKNNIFNILIVIGLCSPMNMQAGAQQPPEAKQEAQPRVDSIFIRKSPFFKYADLTGLKSGYDGVWNKRLEEALRPFNIQLYDTNEARQQLYKETLALTQRGHGRIYYVQFAKDAREELQRARVAVCEGFSNAVEEGKILTPDDVDFINALQTIFAVDQREGETYNYIANRYNANLDSGKRKTAAAIVALAAIATIGTIACIKLIKSKKHAQANKTI